MSQETTRKFVGRAIAIDPRTGEEQAIYVCILLVGEAGVPSYTACQAQTFDQFLTKLREDDVLPHFARAKLTFEPPLCHSAINRSLARQRYEALPYQELNIAQTVLSGR